MIAPAFFYTEFGFNLSEGIKLNTDFFHRARF